MKRLISFLPPLLAAVFFFSCRTNEVSIVPAPLHLEPGSGEFVFTPYTMISVEDEQQKEVAELFAWGFASSAGFVPRVFVDASSADVEFRHNASLKEEEYVLDVEEDHISIEASSPSGFFYATQTLRMVLPPQIDGGFHADNVRWTVPVMKVKDAPRFSYRGLMVDVARYFLPKDALLEIIDCMGMLKLNNLHLHLTDDNGWRLEIKRYPLLTEIGAWRVDRGETPFPDRENPSEGEDAPVGGFYTQEDIREIVSYAAARQINVIPEIDVPAHSNSALAAYPQLACPVVDEYIGVLPGLGGDNAEIIYCAGNDEVLDFLKNVLDEVCELFPSEYIHLGGDEAVKTYWKKCPRCISRIEEEGLADEEALQGWFMAQLGDYLRSKGRTMMGWDELTLSEIPQGAVIFGWQNDGAAALKAAEKGHKFVLTPSKILYLIRYQGPQWFEPLTYFGNATLKNVYDYEPVKATWPAGASDLLLGIQASMWTEFCSSEQDVTYQIFPRLAAFAEVAWSGEKDWAGFVRALDVFARHLDAKGVVYSKAMFNIQHKVYPAGDGTLRVNLQCERPDVSIRYTLDGTTPDGSSSVFTEDIEVPGDLWLTAATFYKDGSQAGEMLEIPFSFNLATGRAVESGHKDASLLTNGVRGSLRQTDFEWCCLIDKDAEFVVDLGEGTPVGRVAVGFLTNYGMGFHKPSEVSVWLSADGKAYTCIGSVEWNEAEIFRKGNFSEDVVFDAEGTWARYVKVETQGAGVCPQWHIRPGFTSRYCLDEIMVDSGSSSGVAGKISEKSRQNLLQWMVYSSFE